MSDQVVSTAAVPVANDSQSVESIENNESNEALDTAEAEQEASEGLKESIEEPKKDKVKAKEELQKRIKKLKLKVDGREIEEDFDMDDEDRLVRELQMSKMGQKRAQEKAELEKELQSFFQALQDDPFSLLANEFKMKPEELIEAYINKQLEIAKKTPEQIEREKLETELRSLQSERQKEKEETQRRELERLQQQEFERYDMLMEQALTKSDIPKSPYIIKKMADLMLVGLEAGMDVTPEDVIPLIREEMHSDLKEMFQVLPEDMIEQLLGDGVINKLRKRRVAKAQEAQKAVAKPKIQDVGKDGKQVEGKDKDKISYKDFFKM